MGVVPSNSRAMEQYVWRCYWVVGAAYAITLLHTGSFVARLLPRAARSMQSINKSVACSVGWRGRFDTVQMKVMFPRAGYARKGGEWSLRVGELVVVVCVCVGRQRSPQPTARACSASPVSDSAKTASAKDAAFRTSACRRANSRIVMAI